MPTPAQQKSTGTSTSSAPGMNLTDIQGDNHVAQDGLRAEQIRTSLTDKELQQSLEDRITTLKIQQTTAEKLAFLKQQRSSHSPKPEYRIPNIREEEGDTDNSEFQLPTAPQNFELPEGFDALAQVDVTSEQAIPQQHAQLPEPNFEVPVQQASSIPESAPSLTPPSRKGGLDQTRTPDFRPVRPEVKSTNPQKRANPGVQQIKTRISNRPQRPSNKINRPAKIGETIRVPRPQSRFDLLKDSIVTSNRDFLGRPKRDEPVVIRGSQVSNPDLTDSVRN